MDKSTNSLNWFEIPANNLGRAKNFYQTIFDIEMTDMPEIMGMKMSAFPAENGSGKANGTLVQSENHKPSTDGAVVYLNANPDIQAVIDRIDAAGGQVLMPKTDIGGDMGFMAFFTDTEGNKVGLHAQN